MTFPQQADFKDFYNKTTALFAQLGHDVESATNWQDKYRNIMITGAKYPTLDTAFHQPEALVKGCESDTWIYAQLIDDKYFFIADSESRIVKGLIALLFNKMNGTTSDTINSLDIKAYFADLGLENQLSPSRTNGIYAITQWIKAYPQLT